MTAPSEIIEIKENQYETVQIRNLKHDQVIYMQRSNLSWLSPQLMTIDEYVTNKREGKFYIGDDYYVHTSVFERKSKKTVLISIRRWVYYGYDDIERHKPTSDGITVADKDWSELYEKLLDHIYMRQYFRLLEKETPNVENVDSIVDGYTPLSP